MEKRQDELIRSLMNSDAELKTFYVQHANLEQMLEVLNQKQNLSSEEETERKRLQKLKLSGMDRIVEILERHRGAVTAPS